jgi:hypothetical protein
MRSGAPIVEGGTEAPRARGYTRTGALSESNHPLVAANGEFNVGDGLIGRPKKDVMAAIQTLYDAAQSGTVSIRDEQGKAKVRAEQEALFQEAIHDRSGEAWNAVGEVIGEEIWETLGREGFARKTLLYKPLGKGEIGRLKIRRKDVVAHFATTDPMTVASVVQQKWVFPPEFYLIANILIENKEIAQSTGDILDEKYQDGLEQIMVREDLTWLTLARTAAPVVNDLYYFNTFTPTVFSTMRTAVSSWGTPVTTVVMAFDLWNDIIADSEFASWFDPVTKHELVLEGNLGSILAAQLITDGFRHENLQVLDTGELFFCAAPQTLGGITQRSELTSSPINRYNVGRPVRGWFMEQIEGMAFPNSRAIARGIRS